MKITNQGGVIHVDFEGAEIQMGDSEIEIADDAKDKIVLKNGTFIYPK